MLKNNFVKIAVKGCRKLEYFKSIGYNINNDFMIIDIKHLSVGSRQLVDVVCDFCNKEVTITYKEYLRNISIGGKYACSKQCGSQKAKMTNIKIFGVEYPMMLKEIQEKAKCTNLEKLGVEFVQQSEDVKKKTRQTIKQRYGVYHVLQNEEIKEKFKQTCAENNGVEYPMMSDVVLNKAKNTFLEKYGVDNPSKSKEIRDKVKKTNLEKWGNENYLLSDDFEKKYKDVLDKYDIDNFMKLAENIDKIKLSNLEKYGVEYPMMLKEIQDKIKITNLEKYGVDNPSKSKEIRDKVKKTNLEKWGNVNFMLTDIFKEKSKETFILKYKSDNINKNEVFRVSNFKIAQDPEYINYISDGYSLFKCYIGHTFSIHSDNYFHRKKYNLPICTICNPIGDQKSIKEKELFEFIKSVYSGDIIQSYRDGLEIDIYLPNLKLGFEFNGLYWHSEIYKDKNYHLDKTNYFKEKGIRIIHIWEDDWDFKNEIIRSQISNWVGVTKNKIFARKCEVREIKNSKFSSNFLNKNHIQGADRSIIKVGLFYDNELFSIITFNKFEGRKKLPDGEYNLSRFCNKINTNVIGSASKLLNYFINFYKPNRIISYADKDWSVGHLYENIGFSKNDDIPPDYKYIINNVRKHKQNFKKINLKIDDNISESDFMQKNGYMKIYDCGKIKYEIKLVEM